MDLGCGHGKFAARYFDTKLTMGLDLSYKALKHARKVQIYKHLVLADAVHISVCDNCFATVFSNSAIEHMPDLRGVLKEVLRVLQPGGTFVFTAPGHLFGEYLFLTDPFERLKRYLRTPNLRWRTTNTISAAR